MCSALRAICGRSRTKDYGICPENCISLKLLCGFCRLSATVISMRLASFQKLSAFTHTVWIWDSILRAYPFKMSICRLQWSDKYQVVVFWITPSVIVSDIFLSWFSLSAFLISRVSSTYLYINDFFSSISFPFCDGLVTLAGYHVKCSCLLSW